MERHARGVPVEQYQELLAAESKDRYCRHHIRQHFPYDRISQTFRGPN